MLAEGSKMSLEGVAIAARSARGSGKGAKTGPGRYTRRSVPNAVLRPRCPLNLQAFVQFIVASASVACGPERHVERALVYSSPTATP